MSDDGFEITEPRPARIRVSSGSKFDKLPPAVAWGTPRHRSHRPADDSLTDASTGNQKTSFDARASNSLQLYVPARDMFATCTIKLLFIVYCTFVDISENGHAAWGISYLEQQHSGTKK